MMRFTIGDTVFVHVNPERLHAFVGVIVEMLPPTIYLVTALDDSSSNYYKEDWLQPFKEISEEP